MEAPAPRVLPAVCDDCGRVWMPNAIAMGPHSRVVIENTRVSPCPYCGGVGHIPDGIYQGALEGIRVFAISPKSAQSLERLRRLLEEARDQKKASGAEVADAIEERAPEYAGVAKFLRKFGRGEVIALATLFVMLIAWYQSHQDSEALLKALETQVQTEQTQTAELEKIYNAIVSQSQGSSASPSSPVKQLGRNDPCWCGSGKKFKRCHGR